LLLFFDSAAILPDDAVIRRHAAVKDEGGNGLSRHHTGADEVPLCSAWSSLENLEWSP
jgi:hypothetical protein